MISNSHGFNKSYDGHYDPTLAVIFSVIQKQDPIGRQIKQSKFKQKVLVERGPQNRDLLNRLEESLVPATAEHATWLKNRGIDHQAHSLIGLRDFEQLDLFIIPADHVIAKHGFRPVDGPAFPDRRNGVLTGVCVRNTSSDVEFVADAKFTFSNYGWFIWGMDDCDPSREVVMCEGVFDAMAMRKCGHQAIAFGSAYPTPQQLAMVRHKFEHLAVCFDNDFWGWYGAYVTNKCLNCRILMPTGKDPAQQVFELNDSHFVIVVPNEIKAKLKKEIPSYNEMAASGWLRRPLPYNR